MEEVEARSLRRSLSPFPLCPVALRLSLRTTVGFHLVSSAFDLSWGSRNVGSSHLWAGTERSPLPMTVTVTQGSGDWVPRTQRHYIMGVCRLQSCAPPAPPGRGGGWGAGGWGGGGGAVRGADTCSEHSRSTFVGVGHCDPYSTVSPGAKCMPCVCPALSDTAQGAVEGTKEQETLFCPGV